MRRALLYLGIFLLILFLLGKRFDAMYPDFTARQFQELFHATEPADIIALGSSTTVHGYDPAIIGHDFFNFGMLGAQPHFYLAWYQLFIAHHPKPSIVIVSLDWFSADANRGKVQDNDVRLVQDSRYLPLSVLLPLFWQSTNHERSILLLNLIRILGIGPDVKYLFVAREDSAMAGYDRGYMPLDASIDVHANDARVFPMNAAFLQDLSTLLDAIQSHGSRAILVEVPAYQPDTIKDLHADSIAEVASSRGIPFLDYNGARVSALNKNPAFFADEAHLNRDGSKVFSEQFRKDLEAIMAR